MVTVESVRVPASVTKLTLYPGLTGITADLSAVKKLKSLTLGYSGFELKDIRLSVLKPEMLLELEEYRVPAIFKEEELLKVPNPKSVKVLELYIVSGDLLIYSNIRDLIGKNIREIQTFPPRLQTLDVLSMDVKLIPPGFTTW